MNLTTIAPLYQESSTLSLSFTDKEQLFHSYMPFIQQGALFVKTKESFKLGEEIYLLVNLMDETEPYRVPGKIVWIMPSQAQAGHEAGIGVQLKAEEQSLRIQIEKYLAN